MSKFIINGGKKLSGEIEIEAAKNAILPIIAGSLLTSEKIVLNNIPQISDVDKMLEIIIGMGGKATRQGKTVIIDNSTISKYEIPKELASEIRSSIFMLGPLVAKFKKARVAYPGGCDIGARPIDLHLSGLRSLGVSVFEEHGYIDCEGESLHSAFIHLDFPSVGATENIMMAATLIEGETIILNPAKEPEIEDLQRFLVSMGACISGAGTGRIVIKGVKSLRGTEFTPMPDRIVTGTYMIMSAITGSKITLKNSSIDEVLLLADKLQKSGCNIDSFGGKIIVDSKSRPVSCSFETQPYPGFPTDLQPQMLALQTVSRGISIVTENLFETRYKHIPELIKMGAQIKVKDRNAIIHGVDHLNGAEVTAWDLRAGAGLVLAGLSAKGETVVNNVEFIERGYENMEQKLSLLGADIKRV